MDSLTSIRPSFTTAQRPALTRQTAVAADTFESSGHYSAPAPSYKDMLQVVRMGAGSSGGQLPGKYVQGEGAIDSRADRHVGAARNYSKQHANERVDWNHPNQALHHLSQVDGQKSTKYDEDRCGAAVLVAGAVLNGPKHFQQGLDNVLNRASNLEATTAENAKMQGQNEELNRAMETLEKLRDKDPKKLTNGEMEKIQDSIYVIANVDQQLNPSGNDFEPGYGGSGLSSAAMKTYSKLLWDGQTPKMNGRDLHIEQVQGGKVDHFVLADGNHVAFNPWPEKTGAAYSRGADGDGARITSGPLPSEGGWARRTQMPNVELPVR